MNRFISAPSMVRVVAASVLMMLSASLPAIAQEEKPCASDFKQYCADVTTGGGRMLRCYEERKEKFSPACREWAERAKSYAEVAKAACAKEIDSFCNSEKGDPLEMLDCLQSNYVDLSSDCRVKLTKFKLMYPKPVQ
jgi:hypothetical protein